MEFKGTKGKWSIQWRNRVFDIISENNVLVAEADTHLNSKYGTPTPEACESNAKLISAAPELLAACIEFVKKCDNGTARSKKSYAQMSEAINKALK